MFSARTAFGLVSALLLTAGAAHAGGKVKLKNCLPDRVLACAYNGSDSSLKSPSDHHGIKPGEKERLSCNSKRCKVFVAVTNLKNHNYEGATGPNRDKDLTNAINDAARKDARCKKVVAWTKNDKRSGFRIKGKGDQTIMARKVNGALQVYVVKGHKKCPKI